MNHFKVIGTCWSLFALRADSRCSLIKAPQPLWDHFREGPIFFPLLMERKLKTSGLIGLEDSKKGSREWK